MNGREKLNVRKSNILGAAEKGFHEGTIPDIAYEAVASEASICGYFSTKENLLFSISLERLKELHEMLQFYSNNPDFTYVLMLVLKQNRKFLNTDGHKEIRECIRILDRVIMECMESGEFRSDIDPYYLSSSMPGAMEHVVTNWLMLGHPENLLDSVDPIFAWDKTGSKR